MATTTVFGSPTAIGAKILTINTTITNVSGQYTGTVQDDRLTASMKAIKLELGNPAAFDAVINVAVNNGSMTISCASVTGTSTAAISVIKVTEDPTEVTSTEFDVLANRISHMTNLFEVTLDAVTNTSGSYTHTTTVEGMTSDLKCVKLECSDPTIFRDTVDITSGSDSVTLTCSNVVGSSTVKASFLSVGNGNPLSSMEYNALDTRIGALSDLDTTDKSNIVEAINENHDKLTDLLSFGGFQFIKEVSAGGSTGTKDTGISVDSANDVLLMFKRNSNDNTTMTIGGVFHTYRSSWIGISNNKYTVSAATTWDAIAIYRIKQISFS